MPEMNPFGLGDPGAEGYNVDRYNQAMSDSYARGRVPLGPDYGLVEGDFSYLGHGLTDLNSFLTTFQGPGQMGRETFNRGLGNEYTMDYFAPNSGKADQLAFPRVGKDTFMDKLGLLAVLGIAGGGLAALGAGAGAGSSLGGGLAGAGEGTVGGIFNAAGTSAGGFGADTLATLGGAGATDVGFGANVFTAETLAAAEGGDMGLLTDIFGEGFDWNAIDFGDAATPWSTDPSLADLEGFQSSTPGVDGGVNPGGLDGPLGDTAVPNTIADLLRQLGITPRQGISTIGQLFSALSSARDSNALRDASGRAVGIQDPFGAERKQYQEMLRNLYANPGSISEMPGYKAGLQAVERRGAAQGWNGSGNMMVALSEYGGNFFDKEANRLATLGGAGISPTGASNSEMTGLIAANQARNNALAQLGLMLPRGT